MMLARQQKDERYDVSTHFGFGENWASYARHIDAAKIAKAEEGLFKLVSPEELKGKRFLDIGCGSGLHSLSALRGGVKEAVCLDIDAHSVETTRAVLAHHWPQSNYAVHEYNILSDALPSSLSPQSFDIVYSWGVLHHTGDMWAAVERAALFVAPGGLFVLALYKKSPLCGAWRMEKKFYTGLPAPLRRVMDYLYAGVYLFGKLLQGENPVAYLKNYEQERGMHFMTDVRDWLGGYPYESASADEVKAKVEAMGFKQKIACNTAPPRLKGVLGCGCAEYVFTRGA